MSSELISVLKDILNEVKVIRKVLESIVSKSTSPVSTNELSIGEEILEEVVKGVEIPYSTKVLQHILNKLEENKQKLNEILGETTTQAITNIIKQIIKQKQSQ